MSLLKHTDCTACDGQGRTNRSGEYCQACNWETGCITCASEEGLGDDGYCDECEFEESVYKADLMMDLAQDK